MQVVGIESKITDVMVFAEGARVTRIARLPASADDREVRLVGLPLALDDASVRISARGAIASGARIVLAATGVEAAEPVDAAAVRAAQRAAGAAEAELIRIDRALAELELLAPPARAEPKEGPRPAWDAALAARLALVELRGAREHQLRAARAEAVRIADDARQALTLAEARQARATTARTPRSHELRKAAIVGLRAITGPIELCLEYLVPGARWAPTYVARLGGGRLALELRAVVAQRTGEDWTGVALALSTAAAQRFTELPELAAAKIGRRQAPPPRAGWRPPPTGAGALYADWDRVFKARVVQAPPPEPPAYTAPVDTRTVTGAVAPPQPSMKTMMGPGGSPFGGPPAMPSFSAPATPMAAPMAAPMMMDAMPMAQAKGGGMARALGGAVANMASMVADGFARKEAGAHAGAPEPSDELAAPADLLAFGELCMPPAAASNRGALAQLGRRARYADLIGATPELDVVEFVDHATRAAGRLAAPPSATTSGWATAFDFAFAADGAVDVPSDGEWHGLALTSADAPSQLRHVVVPREVTDVFRIVELTSPFDAPLLPGPMDVYDGRDFVLTTPVEWVAPRGAITLGLGVDPQVKVTRNTDYREEAAGMLRGSLRLAHEVHLTAENLGARPIDLEVRERVPVGLDGDDDVAVTVESVAPAWEPWQPEPGGPHTARLRGGHRWRLTLAPAERATLTATYAIKIASKHELVGGNRRES
jgi:hypothetical protein